MCHQQHHTSDLGLGGTQTDLAAADRIMQTEDDLGHRRYRLGSWRDEISLHMQTVKGPPIPQVRRGDLRRIETQRRQNVKAELRHVTSSSRPTDVTDPTGRLFGVGVGWGGSVVVVVECP